MICKTLSDTDGQMQGKMSLMRYAVMVIPYPYKLQGVPPCYLLHRSSPAAPPEPPPRSPPACAPSRSRRCRCAGSRSRARGPAERRSAAPGPIRDQHQATDQSQLTSMMTGPRNLAPAGPSSSTREAMASPSIRGGGWINLSFFRYLHRPCT